MGLKIHKSKHLKTKPGSDRGFLGNVRTFGMCSSVGRD